jgi:hypothetical protein
LCLRKPRRTFPQISDSAPLSPIFSPAQPAAFLRNPHEKADENTRGITADFAYEK